MTEARAGRFQARPKRTPLHEQRNKLTVEGRDPERVYRWVNDVDDRIEKFKLGGYRVEADQALQVGDAVVEEGINRTSSVLEKNVGGKTKAILMSTQKDWYEADQAAKQEIVNQSDLAMRRDAQDKSDYGDLVVSRRRK